MLESDLQLYENETPKHVFSFECYEMYEDNFFYRTPPVVTLDPLPLQTCNIQTTEKQYFLAYDFAYNKDFTILHTVKIDVKNY